MGNKAWTLGLEWTGKNNFNNAGDHSWYYTNDQSASINGGLARTANAKLGKGSLTFLQVYEAGHMVPMDQPQAALALLNTFLSDKAFY
jgi:carboxypeptidase C (cathepsin A)